MVRDSPLAGETGWIPVNRGTLATRHERVHAIGDVTTITLANREPLPRAGVFTHPQGLIITRRIAATLAGREAADAFDGVGYCWVEAGDGRAAFATGGFYAQARTRRSSSGRPGGRGMPARCSSSAHGVGAAWSIELARAGLIVGGGLPPGEGDHLTRP